MPNNPNFYTIELLISNFKNGKLSLRNGGLEPQDIKDILDTIHNNHSFARKIKILDLSNDPHPLNIHSIGTRPQQRWTDNVLIEINIEDMPSLHTLHLDNTFAVTLQLNKVPNLKRITTEAPERLHIKDKSQLNTQLKVEKIQTRAKSADPQVQALIQRMAIARSSFRDSYEAFATKAKKIFFYDEEPFDACIDYPEEQDKEVDTNNKGISVDLTENNSDDEQATLTKILRQKSSLPPMDAEDHVLDDLYPVWLQVTPATPPPIITTPAQQKREEKAPKDNWQLNMFCCFSASTSKPRLASKDSVSLPDTPGIKKTNAPVEEFTVTSGLQPYPY